MAVHLQSGSGQPLSIGQRPLGCDALVLFREVAPCAYAELDCLFVMVGLAVVSRPVRAELPRVLIIGDSISIGYTKATHADAGRRG